ncbi:TetR/AcrR family transcriptional regulator [Sulfurivermis fontis]|jgi:AcrR family transcriptional regulator|uniref:TetR/AcrR family transcriptional regulator n=1 Tax=Sulfurivermis fontis TaxID=1972068 RepID=UPI000FDC2B72|nr:TetR/AcrR family transcriptional regulator [Sulfurivermis fontis]
MGKSHDIRRQEIVEATLELAAEQGIKNLTTQAIATRVGIAQPTIFRHFKSRDAIFGAVVGWAADHLLQVLEQLEHEHTPPDDRLRRLLQQQLAFIGKWRGIPRVVFSDRLQVESPALKAAVREIYHRLLVRIADLLEEGRVCGCFRADLDVEQGARYIGALLQGTVMRWSIQDFSYPLETEADSLWSFLRPALERR